MALGLAPCVGAVEGAGARGGCPWSFPRPLPQSQSGSRSLLLKSSESPFARMDDLLQSLCTLPSALALLCASLASLAVCDGLEERETEPFVGKGAFKDLERAGGCFPMPLLTPALRTAPGLGVVTAFAV